MKDSRVVVIEDEPEIRRFLVHALEQAGYEVFERAGGREGLVEIDAKRANAVLLDLGLPDIDGLEVLHTLRRTSRVPVIVLSARGQEEMKVRALDAGADDYLVKPFGTNELLARLRVVLRHAMAPPGRAARLRYGEVEIDLELRSVTRDGASIHLTPTEFRLLAELARDAGRVLTHRQLLNAIWGPSHIDDTPYLRLYMSQLRHKLEVDPINPQILITEQGVGYRLAEAKDAS